VESNLPALESALPALESALPSLESAAPALESEAAAVVETAAPVVERTVSVFHGSINNAANILARGGGLDPERLPTFVSRDVAAAQDALQRHPDAVQGLGRIIESRIPASLFQSILAPLERAYQGFFPYGLQSTEITLRTAEHADLFNRYIVR
jgi:hypothetical protein